MLNQPSLLPNQLSFSFYLVATFNVRVAFAFFNIQTLYTSDETVKLLNIYFNRI